MDQDVLTNGALGALWKQEQSMRLLKACRQGSGRQPPLASPGFLSSCFSHNTNSDQSLGFPQLQESGNKRKANWPELQKTPSIKTNQCGTGAPKRTKFNLKEMADQFAASQVELAARSCMLPRAPHQKSTGKKLPGISQSINVFMSPNPERAVASATQDAIQAQSDMDMSWLDPTPIREEPTPSSKESTNTSSSGNNTDGTAMLRCRVKKEDNTETPAPLVLDPEAVKNQYISTTATEVPSLLHQTVGLFPTNYDLVKGALDLNPEEVRRKAPLPKEADPAASNTTMTSQSPDSFGYPLNIALQNDASLEVLKLLTTAAPEVIVSRDGCDECGSLSLVLRRKTCNSNKFLQVLHLLIKANPMSLQMTDRRRNTPLHIALAGGGGASLPLVRVLCMLYPPALLQTNLNGETPLQVAQRSTTLCQENVLTFVQEAYNQELCRVSSSKD